MENEVRVVLNGVASITRAKRILFEDPVDGTTELRFAKAGKNRSYEQNRTLWRWYSEIRNEKGQPEKEMHEAYKRKFLIHIFARDDESYYNLLQHLAKTGDEALKIEFVKLTSTKNCTRKQMTEYMEKVFEDASTMGIRLTDPELNDLLGNKLPKAKKAKETPSGLRLIRRIFKHRDSTKPKDKEIKKYLDLEKRITEPEMMDNQIPLMVAFYKLKPKDMHGGITDFWAHGVERLLNAWDDKIACAREKVRGAPSTAGNLADRKVDIPEPENWKAVADSLYGPKEDGYWDAPERTWKKVGGVDGVQEEIARNCK